MLLERYWCIFSVFTKALKSAFRHIYMYIVYIIYMSNDHIRHYIPYLRYKQS